MKKPKDKFRVDPFAGEEQKQVLCRMPLSLYESLCAWAIDEGVSLSELIRRSIAAKMPKNFRETR
jgi:hypothetical protein